MLVVYSEMKGYDYFDRIFNVMSIENRIQLFLLIWQKGEFKSKLLQDLHIQDSREIEIVVNEFKKLGFLEIITYKENTAIPKYDAYYIVTEENLKNILKHICEFSSLSYSDLVFEILHADRTNFSASVVEEFQGMIKSELLRDRVFSLLIERSISFFFIHIMEYGRLFKERREIKFFFNDFMIETLLTTLIRGVKLEILEKEYSEKFKERDDQEYYMVKPWKKNIA